MLYAMTQLPVAPTICAACSTPGTGRFCSSCGASLEPTVCAGCAAPLTPGSRFCHNCGMQSGAQSPPALRDAQPAKVQTSNTLPWIVAAIALVMLLAFLAGGAFNKRRGSALDAPQNALPQAGLDDRATSADQSGSAAIRGPDISQLSPQERADRLFNRVMLLDSQSKTDSVLFFAPMAISAYQMLSPMNADQRYDLGRIAEVAGALTLARAQADTILAGNSAHLLGLVLASRIATLENRTTDARGFAARLLSASQPGAAKKLPEYERHGDDIAQALVLARRSAAAAK